MESRHKTGPRRGAYRRAGIELGETQALRGQGIDIGSADLLLAITTQVAIAEVIREDENDIGTGGLNGGECRLRGMRMPAADGLL
jgi:hypothetical protein